MKTLAIIGLSLTLAACGQRADNSESANDFAQRVGTGKAAPAPTDAPGVTSAVKEAPAPSVDVFAPEKLGNIANLDLGPRAGGCTFSVDGEEMLVAAGPKDVTLPGKAAVRLGGKLLLLDAPPGGYNVVKNGTTFTGEGFTVAVAPAAPGRGTMTITNSAGQQKAVAGNYACS